MLYHQRYFQIAIESLGRAVFHLGPLGLGNTMKLMNSLIAFSTTWVSLESLALGAKAGIPVADAVEVLRTAGPWLERPAVDEEERGIGPVDRRGPPDLEGDAAVIGAPN